MNLTKINENFEIDISNIEFSKADLKRGIRLPTKLSEELAEIIGNLVGDGHIGIQDRINAKTNYKHYEIRLGGHLMDDYEYYKWINRLYNKIFNINLNFKSITSKNYLKLSIDSKALVCFLSNVIGLSLGNKTSIAFIPRLIIDSPTPIKCAFIRGLSDTDFSLTFKKTIKTNHSYPVIKGSVKSKKLANQTTHLLANLGFNPHLYYENKFDKRFNKNDKIYSIYINGKINLEKWMNIIGFNNPKHMTKYWIWKKFGFCPPNTNLKERKKILSGKLNPYSSYK